MLVVSFGAAPADAAGALDAKPTIPHADPPPPFGGRTSKARLVAAAPPTSTRVRLHVGYRRSNNRPAAENDVNWHIASLRCAAKVGRNCEGFRMPSLGASIPTRRCFREPRRAGLPPLTLSSGRRARVLGRARTCFGPCSTLRSFRRSQLTLVASRFAEFALACLQLSRYFRCEPVGTKAHRLIHFCQRK